METAKFLKQRSVPNVGLLATRKSVGLNLYKRTFDRSSITTLVPDEQTCDKITKIIFNIFTDKKDKNDKGFLLESIEDIRKRGAKAIVPGCTDFTIILRQEDSRLLLIDTVDVLAEAAAGESFCIL